MSEIKATMVLANKFYALADMIAAVIKPGLRVKMPETIIYARIANGKYTGEWDQDCGSPGCAAGWCAVALHAYCPCSRYTSYFDGYDAVDKYFGFSLNDWADSNRELWGNDSGYYVWSANAAWNQDSAVFPPQVLVDHLRAVARRIEIQLRVDASLAAIKKRSKKKVRQFATESVNAS